MTEQETAQLVAVICLAYPNVEQTPERIALWHEFLKEADGNRAMRKLREHIETEKFPPSISDISIVIKEQQEDEREKREEWLRLNGYAESMPTLKPPTGD